MRYEITLAFLLVLDDETIEGVLADIEPKLNAAQVKSFEKRRMRVRGVNVRRFKVVTLEGETDNIDDLLGAIWDTGLVTSVNHVPLGMVTI